MRDRRPSFRGKRRARQKRRKERSSHARGRHDLLMDLCRFGGWSIRHKHAVIPV
jgi:hypothetical protein